MALGKNDHERATRARRLSFPQAPSVSVAAYLEVPSGARTMASTERRDRGIRTEVYSSRVQVWVLQRMNTQPVTFKVPESVSSNSER